jgi:hypothetical protein
MQHNQIGLKSTTYSNIPLLDVLFALLFLTVFLISNFLCFAKITENNSEFSNLKKIN